MDLFLAPRWETEHRKSPTDFSDEDGNVNAQVTCVPVWVWLPVCMGPSHAAQIGTVVCLLLHLAMKLLLIRSRVAIAFHGH